MSEMESVEAPQSTADVAAAVIDSYDEPAASTETPVETTEAPAATDTPAVVAPKLSEVEQLLHDAGYTSDKTPDGRYNRIPYPRVKEMIENGLKKGRGDWDTKYSTLETEAKELREHLKQLHAGISGDEVAFLTEIASVDPRYKRFLEPPAPVQPTAASAEMPTPDLPLPDGSRTYSLEGIQKLLDWKAQQIAQQFDAKLKPLTEREQKAQEAARREQLQQQSRAKAQSQMEEAQTWPLFGPIAADKTLTPFQAEVFAAYKADPSLDLRAAYMKVALPKLTADRNKLREEWVKETNSAPKSTATARQTTDAPKAGSGRTTADIAAAAMARLEKGA